MTNKPSQSTEAAVSAFEFAVRTHARWGANRMRLAESPKRNERTVKLQAEIDRTRADLIAAARSGHND